MVLPRIDADRSDGSWSGKASSQWSHNQGDVAEDGVEQPKAEVLDSRHLSATPPPCKGHLQPLEM